MTLQKLGLLSGLIMVCSISSAHAQQTQAHYDHEKMMAMIENCDCHAMKGPVEPASVMGAHMHKKGDWMLSYRYMRMEMDGVRDGTSDLTPEQVITYPNPNGPPANFRVVGNTMETDMHMLGGMFAPADWLTIMAMAPYVKRSMESIVFQGMMGTTRLGTSSMQSSGWGDAKLTSLIRLYEDDMHHVHLNAGLSLPTGSIDEEDTMLTPMNTQMRMRMAYGMQLGSGTFDAMPGVTYTGHSEKWGWGAQYIATIPLEDENSEGYSWGNKHQITAWSGYKMNDWLSFNASAKATHQGKIDGSDVLITGPMQGNDPDNYGGEKVFVGAGFDIKIPVMERMRFGANVELPVYQNLNGPQMKSDWMATAGLRVGF
jgi:hypothetical protein